MTLEDAAPAIDKALFRQVAGSFASGVTVITTGTEGAYRGFTASAFSSLSLDPPLILVCVDRNAQTLPTLQQTGAFAVNILERNQEVVSRRFSTRSIPNEERMHGVAHRLGDSGVPVLQDAFAYFECVTLQEYEGGDHIILVGRVIDAGIAQQGEPLLYFRGRYHALNQPLAG